LRDERHSGKLAHARAPCVKPRSDVEAEPAAAGRRKEKAWVHAAAQNRSVRSQRSGREGVALEQQYEARALDGTS
jgi:hypothetical protein